MGLFGGRHRLPDGMRRPSPLIPVDMQELPPVGASYRQAGPGEPVPAAQQFERGQVEQMEANRPRGLFGGLRKAVGTNNGISFADRMFMAGAILNDRPDVALALRQDLMGRAEKERVQAMAGELSNEFAQAYGQPMQPGGPDPMQRIMPLLMKAQAAGLDVGGYLKAAEALEGRNRRNSYLSTLPENVRPEADLDPNAFASYSREQRTPSFHAVAPGTSIVGVDRGTGTARPVFSNPRPTEPMSTDQLTASVIQRAMQGGELNPQEQAVMNRHLFGTDQGGAREPTPNSVYGGILQKYATGQPLSPQEEQLRSAYLMGQVDPMKAYMQMILGGGAGGSPAAAGGAPAAPAAPPLLPQRPPPGRPPARGANAAGSSRNNPARPKSRAEAEALPSGAWFVDPKGNLLQKR